ncbi:dockerin type I domain-containing protein [Bacillus sp. JJ664]
MQLVNFDLVTVNRYNKDFAAQWYSMEFTGTSIDQSDVQKNNVYTYMEAIDLKQTHYSRLEGQMKLEGTIDPTTGQTNWALDQQNIGAKVTVTSYDGKNVADAFFINTNGNYVADELNADSKPYTIKVDVPGHFTMYKSLLISDEVRGETLGRRLGFSLTQAKAGDVNKDNVIDIVDAIEIQNNWGTNSLRSDLNFDKVVDKKDMNFVIKNFGLQNPSVSDAPKVKSSYKGVTLEDVLTKLGLK